MDQFERWRKCWETSLMGTRFDPGTPDGQTIVASLELAAKGSVKRSEGDTSDVIIRGTADHLRALAIAWRTPGTTFYKSEAVLQEIVDGLDTVYRQEYYPDCSPDNWWITEVGHPQRLFDTLILLWDVLPNAEAQAKRFTDVFVLHQDDYLLQTHGRGETGANLVWKCSNLILCGILRRDMAFIDKANALLPRVLRYSARIEIPGSGSLYDDGFYPDGSFIQHYFIAYTGGYGKHLLNNLANLIYAFYGQGCLTLPAEALAFFVDRIEKAWAPLVYRGHLMDVVRGREVSRYFYQDYIGARHITRSLCRLAVALPAPLSIPLRALAKSWLAEPEVRENLLKDESSRAEYWVSPSLAEVLAALEADACTPAPALIGHFHFGVMCVPVHRAAHWAAAISMYSHNISCYEYLGRESTKFWHISDGMLYLYDGNADRYDHNYYATADMQRLPGTTVDRAPDREKDPYYYWAAPQSRNKYAIAGGVVFGDYGSVIFQYCGQGRGTERNLEVKKSWFFLGDEIVCLGSGISSSTGDEIETILFNDIVGAEDVLLVNGTALACTQEQVANSVQTLHLGPTGYFMPHPATLHFLAQHRAGTWNTAEVNPKNYCENDFCTAWLNHGAKPDKAQYAYVVLPGRSPAQTAQYAAAPPITLLENSAAVHAVVQQRTGLTAIHFFESGSFGGITASAPCCVILRKTANDTELAVADPTKELKTLELCFDFCARLVPTPCAESLATVPLRILLHPAGCEGATIHLLLQGKE